MTPRQAANLGAALVLATVAAGAVALPATSPAETRCDVGRGKVLRFNVRALVFKDRAGNIYACWRRTGRRTTLFRPLPRQSLDGNESTYLTLQGRYVGSETIVVGRRGEEYRLRIVDVRKGRNVHSTVPIQQDVPAHTTDRRYGAVEELLIDRDGDAVWIARGLGTARPFGTEPRLQVYKVDREPLERLDDGPGVERRSLALSRSGAIYWTNSGQARRAKLD